MPSEHLTDGESASLFFAGLLAPALIFGGVAGIAAGLYFDTATDSLIVEVVFGSAAFGAGCGLLGVLGFYHWHRVVVEDQRDRDKMPLEYKED
jgi:hypothetical protein